MSDHTLLETHTVPPALQDPTGLAALTTRAKETALATIQRGALRVMAMRGEPLARVMTRSAQVDPYHVYDDLRASGPLWRGKRIPVWVAPTYDACYALARDLRLSVDNRLLPGYKERDPDSPLGHLPYDHEMILRMDPPDHTRVRRLLSRAFTPRAVERLRPRIEEIAHDLLNPVTPDGRMDVVRDYAIELPILAICEMLGVPTSDRAQFHTWGDAVAQTLALNVSPAELRRARRAEYELVAYLERLCDNQRANPRDNILSAMLVAEQDGDRLSHREVIANCLLLLVAGFETTVNLISNGTVALMSNPDQMDDLRSDPTIAPNAVDELLRFDSPVQFTSRNALDDMEVLGQQLKGGEEIGLLLGAANNDPDVFAEPRRLDLRRPNASTHLAFSSGPHYCLGAALARLEGEVAFTVLLERCRELRPGGRAVRRRNELLRGYEHLPVTFRAS